MKKFLIASMAMAAMASEMSAVDITDYNYGKKHTFNQRKKRKLFRQTSHPKYR